MAKVKLHLGCGKRYIQGFVHIDLNYSPHVDFKHDIRNLPMVRSNTVDLIYCCHGIEYFDRIEIIEVLQEWKRVLKKGGMMRLAMPDFEALAKVYRRYEDLDKILGPLYGRWEIKAKNGKANILYHKTVYDFQSIKKLLESQGFVKVKRYDWRKTIHKDYDDYSQSYIPHMDKKHGILISLNIEAVKS
jgi:predicted SAM-dependent methyltransferase